MELHERLAKARKSAGFDTAVDAAKALGVKYPTYAGHENGASGFRADTGGLYARRFKVRFEWLMRGLGPMVDDTDALPVTTVPLVSWVSAGRLADASSQLPVEDVPLLAFSDLGPGDYFALRVQGDSMDRYSPDGSVIVVDRDQRSLQAGKPYVFAVRGEATYKLWRPKPPRLEPYSTNPSNSTIFIDQQNELEIVGRVRRTLLDL